ncbi:MAG: glycoside hydrolase family 43 protein [Caldimonas sp.]
MNRLSFAGFTNVVSALLIALSALCGEARAAPFMNPIVDAAPRTGSADPSVVFHRGYYYYCRSIGDAAIGVSRARRLQDIGAAPVSIVFRPPAGTPYSRQIWAPELQFVRGGWVIYFAASDGDNAHHRMYALQARSADPQGAYAFRGQVTDRTDVWAIDGLVLELKGALYFVWSGWAEATSGFPQGLYIARMRDPWTIVGARRLIAMPDQPWEQAGAALLEGPAVLQRRGRTHIVYSASASWRDDYGLGLLTYTGGDVLSAANWVKRQGPVLARDDAASVYSVGHCSLVGSPDGREDWIVYHATSRPGAGWGGRSVRAQRFGWRADGTPEFGRPVPLDARVEEPSGTPGTGRQERAEKARSGT